MQTFRLVGKTGADGALRLSLPLGKETEYEVVVVQVKGVEGPRPTPEERGWPPGFFERTYGSITDETFVRHPQGEFETRLPLEGPTSSDGKGRD
jgi:hypothetical protein